LVAALQILLGLAYPALIYLTLRVAEPRVVALCVLGVLVLRMALSDSGRLTDYARAFRLPALAVAAALLVSAVWNDPVSLLLAPVLISLALLVVFARSLTQTESIVERIARVQLGVLSPEEARYCRRVTIVWCGFFLGNGLVALHLALAGPLFGWALYTGFIAYLLMGALFASEFVYRQWRFRRYLGAPTDFLFRRIFPPRSP
jgi:uncharacterized membrane protein